MQLRHHKLNLMLEEQLYINKCIAFSDLIELYDNDGELIPYEGLPRHVQVAVKQYDVKPDGSYRVEFKDKPAALEWLWQYIEAHGLT
jgi:hypothetical protein